jgi:hypothetical protein
MKRLTLAAAITALLLMAGVPAASAAGTYEVTTCNAAPDGQNNSWTWSSTDLASPDHYSEHSICPYPTGGNGSSTDQESGLSTTDTLGLSDGAGPSAEAGWTFNAPEGSSISAITYERFLGHRQDSQNDWVPALRADDTILPGQSCQDTIENGERCVIGGPPGHGTEPATITGLAAHQLSFGIHCVAPSGEECITGATLHAAWAAMYGATVTVTDPNPPTLAAPSGELWEPAEYHHGTQAVDVAATDQGGGVKTMKLAADGQPVATYEAVCDYSRVQPCPSSTGEQPLSLPTAQLTDGSHTLTLTTTDAAGNQSMPISEQITVVNNPPPPPLNLQATETSAGSTTFTATWTNPPGQIAPIATATYRVCPVSSPAPCGEPTAISANGPATISVPGPGTWDLAVWLSSAAQAGTPQNAGHISLIVQTTQTPGPRELTRNSPSAPDSAALGTLPPSGPSPLHVRETIHGRSIVVSVTGAGKRLVRVALTARIKTHVVFAESRSSRFKHGQAIMRFQLGHRASKAAQLVIRVTVAGRTVTRRLNLYSIYQRRR